MSSTSVRPKELELTRDELLEMLKGIDIHLGNTKLSVSFLRRRLNKALDASLSLCKLPETNGPGIDIHTLPQWEEEPSIMDAFVHFMGGGYPDYLCRAIESVQKDEVDNGIAAFRRTMRHILHIVRWVQMENISWVLLTAGDQGAIRHVLIKIRSVLKIHINTPLLLVEYVVRHSRNSEEFDSYIDPWMSQLPPDQGYELSITLFEEEMLIILLERNNKRLSDHLQPESSDGLRLSFIAPIAGPQPRDNARLNKNSGCEVCGKNTKHLCGCRNVQYCGPVCQKRDWDKHKPTCKPLSTAKWPTVFMSVALVGINEFGKDDPRTESMAYKYKTIVLIKLLVVLSHPTFPNRKGKSIIVVDHNATMLMEVEECDLEAWAAIYNAFGKRGVMYRWGRRVKYDEWEICFDCAPQRQYHW